MLVGEVFRKTDAMIRSGHDATGGTPHRHRQRAPFRSEATQPSTRVELTRSSRNPTPIATCHLWPLATINTSDPLDDREIALQFPRGHLHAIVVPLLPFGFDEPLENVLAQSLDDHLIRLKCLKRLVQ